MYQEVLSVTYYQVIETSGSVFLWSRFKEMYISFLKFRIRLTKYLRDEFFS